jgi:5'-3' exonuclease
MIIVDFNQVMISSLMAQLGNHTNIPIEEGLFRHMVLNSIRSYKQKFSQEYGEIVIACDDKNYWRKQLFPYYKANRKKHRDSSELDWTTIFNCFNKIKQELKDNFPYRVIQVETAEADDIIATLAGYDQQDTLILSGDKDFIQLHNDTIKQYDPVKKKFIKHDNPVGYLYEHILKGDAGDGIPNILSDDDVFVVEGKRQNLLHKNVLMRLPKQLLTAHILFGVIGFVIVI